MAAQEPTLIQLIARGETNDTIEEHLNALWNPDNINQTERVLEQQFLEELHDANWPEYAGLIALDMVITRYNRALEDIDIAGRNAWALCRNLNDVFPIIRNTHAIARNALELVEILLSFGAPVDEQSRLRAQRAQDNGRISILITTRLEWREIGRNRDIRFERVMRLIKTLPDYNRQLQEQTPVFIFGHTMHGKSTLVNYLLGETYEIIQDGLNVTAIPIGNIDGNQARIGDGINSTTVIPRGYDIPNHVLLVDMPGIQDARGNEIEIVAELAAQRIRNLCREQGIRAIIFVCEALALLANVGQYCDVSARILSYVRNIENINVLLVVTRADLLPHINIENTRSKLNGSVANKYRASANHKPVFL